MIIQHNMLANFTQRELKISTGQKTKSTEKLSSGYRINRSADDAAGLSISEKMRWNIRGLDKASNNCQDGVSLIQVADGALNEVHDILDRMKELSIQAANDTNTFEDRQAIQKEINELVEEIDRIGDTTEFNTKPLFKGSNREITDLTTGETVSIYDVPFSNFSLDVILDNGPIIEGSNGQYLDLRAVLKGNYDVSLSKTWGLIYGNGSTSHSNFRYNYKDDNGVTHTGSSLLENMSVVNSIKIDENKFSRTFSFAPEEGVSFEITQSIKIGTNNGTSQYYNMDYSVKNTGSRNANYELMYNVDSAYNNNDRCENYYINNTKMNLFTMYSSNASYQGNSNVRSDLSTALDFSVYNAEDENLPFSVNIKLDGTKKPETILFGNWSTGTYNWEDVDSFRCGLGSTTNLKDKAFSVIWEGDLAAGATDDKISFKQGIIKASADKNVNSVVVNGNPPTGVHLDKLDLWIQSGQTEKNGWFISVGEMNSSVIGIKNLDVSSFESAGDAISRVDKAIEKISGQRSFLGAQQNRLEFEIKIDDNTSENTQYAESRIRDTDMAKEMVTFSKHNIVEQLGQSMLTQANQSTQGILSLLT